MQAVILRRDQYLRTSLSPTNLDPHLQNLEILTAKDQLQDLLLKIPEEENRNSQLFMSEDCNLIFKKTILKKSFQSVVKSTELKSWETQILIKQEDLLLLLIKIILVPIKPLNNSIMQILKEIISLLKYPKESNQDQVHLDNTWVQTEEEGLKKVEEVVDLLTEGIPEEEVVLEDLEVEEIDMAVVEIDMGEEEEVVVEIEEEMMDSMIEEEWETTEIHTEGMTETIETIEMTEMIEMTETTDITKEIDQTNEKF